MLKLIDFQTIRALLQHDGAKETLRYLREYIRQDYARWHEFEKTPRLATHYPWGVIELMPISDSRHYAFKYVNGHPGNPDIGKQSIVAFGVLADVDTGYPLLLSEMTVLTALRTAATSALVAQLCARPESCRLAMIGAGSQAAFQVLALSDVMPITEILCFDLRSEAVKRLQDDLAPFGLHLVSAASIEEAVHGADVVTTATAAKRHQQILTLSQVSQGMHINAIGGDCPGKTELDPRILEHARVIVEYAPQTCREGELQLLPADTPVTELWTLVNGQETGRFDNDQVTLFDSVGFALEDYAALRYLRDRTEVLGLGIESSLLPDLSNTHGLFRAAALEPKAVPNEPPSNLEHMG